MRTTITITTKHEGFVVDQIAELAELSSFKDLLWYEALQVLIDETKLTLETHCNRDHVTMQNECTTYKQGV